VRLAALRTRELLREPRLLVDDIAPVLRRRLQVRASVLPACALAACVLAFFIPGWNMLAMVPMPFVPGLART
jgi:hypothetical protein